MKPAPSTFAATNTIRNRFSVFFFFASTNTRRLVPLPKFATDACLVAYCASDKVAGLMRLPPAGNPKQMMGLVAHAGKAGETKRGSSGG